MKQFKVLVGGVALLVSVMFAGCHAKSPDVESTIRKSLDGAGLKDVTVSQDRDKGVVTLGGNVKADTDKAQAESIAKSAASDEVVADQIAVLPAGGESDAKAENSDHDKAIENNLDAALIQNQLKKHVRFDVKNGVVTLKGKVDSSAIRAQAEQIATGIPNVAQVVNELETTNQRATSSR